MSRLTSMSPEAIRTVFSPDADSDLYMLLTIYDENNQPTIRLSDGFTQRLSETEAQVIYGVKSRGQDYMFIPMNITLPTEESAQAPRCSITLEDVTRYVTPIIRAIDYSPKVLLELILSKTPDIVEASFGGFYITSVTYNANTVQFEINMIDYNREPFPQYRFSPAYFPGMF